jgi:hypothetical protein
LRTESRRPTIGLTLLKRSIYKENEYWKRGLNDWAK